VRFVEGLCSVWLYNLLICQNHLTGGEEEKIIILSKTFVVVEAKNLV
jgi:hypothetical protein